MEIRKNLKSFKTNTIKKTWKKDLYTVARQNKAKERREFSKETNSFATNRPKQAIKTIPLGVLVLLLFRCRCVF